MRDLKSNVDVAQSIVPLLRTTTVSGSGVNLAGYDSAIAIIECGALTDGTFTPKLQESADNSSFTDVVAADIQGALVACTANGVQRVGYKGTMQYLKAVITVTGSPSTGANVSAVIVRGHPSQAPLA